jgi:hypothetical protein
VNLNISFIAASLNIVVCVPAQIVELGHPIRTAREATGWTTRPWGELQAMKPNERVDMNLAFSLLAFQQLIGAKATLNVRSDQLVIADPHN